jgi:type VI secretion system protein ImpC
MATSLIFELGFALPDAEPAAPGQPFRILLLGDFSGGSNPQPLAQRPARRIDIDNFDAELARMAPAIGATVDGEPITVQPRELDDFHPDQLYQKSHAFTDLRAQRERLRNPATFAQAAQELTGLPHAPAAAGPAQAAAQSAQSSLERLVRQLVGQLPSGPDPRQADYVAAADAVIAARMRALLHDPAFQQVEAAWRGARLLATSLELDGDLHLHVLDASAAELRAEPQALHRVLVERSGADSEPWSLLCCLHAFDDGEDDIHTLSVLGALAAQAQAPLLAAAAPSLVAGGVPAPPADDAAGQDAAARWQQLRSSPQARWIGVTLPRILLRLPYGKATDPVAAFAFEETDGVFGHEQYLWGAGSLACAAMLGRAFQDNGWDMTAGDVLDLDDLPAHVVRKDGEAHLQPCGERLLAEPARDALLAQGLMPLLSHKNRAAVRLARSQSIASPAQELAGPWNA